MSQKHIFEYAGRVIATITTLDDGPAAMIEITSSDKMTEEEWEFLSNTCMAYQQKESPSTRSLLA